MNKEKKVKKSEITSLHFKKTQNKKSEITSLHFKKAQNKKAQEEMVGFALIMIVVAVILLIFLGFKFSSHKEKEIQSYEVDSFISSALKYTSDCNDYLGRLSVSDLISKCKSNQECLDGRSACEVLNKTLSEICFESWEKQNPFVKGYELILNSEAGEIISLKRGNKTNVFKGSTPVAVSGVSIELKVYY